MAIDYLTGSKVLLLNPNAYSRKNVVYEEYVDTLVCTLFLFLSRQDYWVHGISVEVCKRTLSLGAIVFLSCCGNRQVKYSRVIQNTKCKKRIIFNYKNYYACQGTIRFCAFLHFMSHFLC